ncbi:MAG: NifU family protein [Flavobacteriales bacterium]|nr:NifU family protein [Flavobacteriales bacterium]MCB9365342.1 NifU family protein [Flavobacteriales bacterium]
MEKTQLPYTIYAEMTPNPNSMKFVSNRWLVTNDKSYEILANQRVGGPSPLAEKLFSFPFINGVFIAGNFVSITKSEAIEWQDVLLELRDFISEYLNSEGAVVIREEFLNTPEANTAEAENTTNQTSSKKEYTDFEKKIAEILDEYIKPAVESDGGAIELDSFDNGVVKVILKGSCSGCPSSTMTLKHGIESMLKNMLPEVTEVEAING